MDLIPQEDTENESQTTDDGHWREEYLRESAQSKKYRRRAQKAEEQIAELDRRALTDDQYREYQKLQHVGGMMAEKDSRIETLENNLRQTVASDRLGKALSACGLGSSPGEALSHATKLLSGRVKVDATGPAPAVTVLDEAGEPMLDGSDDDGKPITVEHFVAQWLADEGSHFLPATGDTGSGAYKGLVGPAAVSVEQLDKDPARKAQFIATHGPQAYVQLARSKRK